MVQIVGTYELVSQKNYEAYLKALGLKDEQVQKIAQSKSPLVVSALDSSKIVASYAGQEVAFALNQKTEHALPTGTAVKTTATVNGDTVTFKTNTVDGKVADERVFKVTDTGLTSTSTVNGVVAVRQYKRI